MTSRRDEFLWSCITSITIITRRSHKIQVIIWHPHSAYPGPIFCQCPFDNWGHGTLGLKGYMANLFYNPTPHSKQTVCFKQAQTYSHLPKLTLFKLWLLTCGFWLSAYREKLSAAQWSLIDLLDFKLLKTRKRLHSVRMTHPCDIHCQAVSSSEPFIDCNHS